MTNMIGKPSGTMATKMAMATMNWATATSLRLTPGFPYETIMLRETRRIATMRAINPRNFPKLSSFEAAFWGLCLSDVARDFTGSFSCRWQRRAQGHGLRRPLCP